MNKVKMNLCCGSDIREGYMNIDLDPVDDRVLKVDLNKLPLPFPSDFADEIRIEHGIEHLDCNLFKFTKELIRIKKPNGIIIVITPVDCSIAQHTRNNFTIGFFNSFIRDFQRDHPNPEYIDQTVEHIEVIRKYKTLKEVYVTIKKKLRLLCIKELEYRFIK